uniref:Mitochondrial nucleoid factor 1 n=1 Tax=Pyxicephalus adspersus TaxID=30357 RepID=A0AAV3B452_PYXAD|nr:TPA: hypothetical protein GDO54_001449 [Pyxicephalus adspersus]
MAAVRYRRFLKLCEEWPVDETRRGRDLGSFLRQRVAQIQDPEVCDQMYESLNRINSSYYKEKYPRLQDTSFTEITAEEYRMVLATDNLKQMDESNKGMWKRLLEKFNTKPPQDGAKE